MMSLENCSPLPYQELSSSFDWDLHTLASPGDHHHHLLEDVLMPFAEESPASTGYLQDAVAPWRNRPRASEELERLGYCQYSKCCCDGDQPRQISNGHMMMISPEDASLLNMLLLDAEPQQEPLSSSSSYEEPQDQAKSPPPPPASKVKPLAPKECEKRQFKKMKMARKSVTYPFAVVKPGGVDGDVTLQDINARLLMRPRWPVRHPVGDHGPRASPNGRGLSGKAIVSLTRIQTQGRGTITILRTRG